MCTALTYKSVDTYFGRTLDIERSHGEKIVLTPRNFALKFKNGTVLENHFALLGTAAVADGCPLYFDAVNEKGLAMAGLNFPENAVYNECLKGKNNLASFELLWYILGRCESVSGAQKELENINITNESFSEKLPASPLHFIVADKDRAITVEPVANGLKIYENTVGVLTNNPSFDYHTQNIINYMGLSNKNPENKFSKRIELKSNSRGMGAIGLPGDLSSASRFVRAAFFKENAFKENTNEKSVMQFFNIMGSVNQVNGCNILDDGKSEYTVYTSCINLNKGVYYSKTYYSGAVSRVDITKEKLDKRDIKSWDFSTEPQIYSLN